MNETLTALAPIIIAVGGMAAFLRYRSQNASDDATANDQNAAAALKWQDVYQQTIDDLRARVDDLGRQVAESAAERSDLRDRARAAEAAAKEAAREAAVARTKQAEAQERVAELEAEIARLILEASEQRHALQNEIKARDLKYDALQHQFEELTERFETLQAQLGKTERRTRERRDDDQS